MIKGFRPLLAATADNDNFDKLVYPMLASPKLDGIRCIVMDGMLYSRTLKPIRNQYLQKALCWDNYNGLDGEIIVGDPCKAGVFRDTTSGVMAEYGNIEGWCYHVFDNYANRATGFECRYNSLLLDVNIQNVSTMVQVVKHKQINNAEELLAYEDECLTTGYEGVMLRSMKGPYKFGRSTFREGTLIKLKRGQLRNGDAEIIGFTERMHNENTAQIDALGLQKRSSEKSGMVPRGDLGSLRVRDVDTGFEFSIGTGVGLNDSLRAEVWQNQKDFLGKIVRYEWFAYGNYDKPRFPKFVCFRDKEDM